MGFRFGKSINLGGGARVNISKKGIGASIGGGGFRVAKKAGGGTRTTASIAGTGVRYQKDSSSSKSQPKSRANVKAKTPFKLFSILLKIMSVIMFAFGTLLFFALPPIGAVAIVLGYAEWKISNVFKKLAIRQKKEEE
jgi:hypothetical protein